MGEVVLVDMWATCVAEFPQTVQLSRLHKHEGLVAVSVNFDGSEREDAVWNFFDRSFHNSIAMPRPGGAIRSHQRLAALSGPSGTAALSIFSQSNRIGKQSPARRVLGLAE